MGGPNDNLDNERLPAFLPLRDGHYRIDRGQAREWAAKYPEASIAQGLREMAAWLAKYPARRPYRRNFQGFVERWLEGLTARTSQAFWAEAMRIVNHNRQVERLARGA